MITVGNILDFVMANKGFTTFMGYTKEEIAGLIQTGVEAGTCFYATDEEGKLTGMILAEKDDDKKVVFVTENLATTLTNLKKFARMSKAYWPEYRLEAIRHGQHRIFNSKFYNKLIK